MESIFETLQSKGYKLTQARRLLAEYLEGNTCHPSPLEIYEDLKRDLSLATVYNTLETFKELGVIKEHSFFKDQVHIDPDTSHHHHFCCKSCHAIFDVHETQSKQNFSQILKRTGFQVDEVSLVFSGLCKNCQTT